MAKSIQIKKKTESLSTEEKIKAAASKLFTQKGFAAVKTRDIVQEAGINLALLNYYFRSKEQLFEIIMKENMGWLYVMLLLISMIGCYKKSSEGETQFFPDMKGWLQKD